MLTVALVMMTAITLFGPFADRTWEQPIVLFGVVSAAAILGISATTVTIALADRREMAEFGLLGTALMAAAVLPLVRGLVTPGVLYTDTEAFHTAAFLTVPAAMLLAAPLLRPDSSFGRWAARRWRDWTLLSLLGIFVLGSFLVFLPDAIVFPGPSSPFTWGVAIAMMVVVGMLARRQLRLYQLGRRPANLVAAFSLSAVACSALLPVVATPFSAPFWWLHAVGLLGVMGAGAALIISRGLSSSTQAILGPVLTRDPLAAFELGISKVVHEFVADLEKQDERTRDHTVRTGELAIRVGERMRLNGSDLRELGLAAMLHDVGKGDVPVEVLNKPGRLTDEEFEIIKLHTVYGEAMLAAEPTLRCAARIVRSHHERVDGRGYPDGLAGNEIPLASRIIAACDALDAMTHDRPHREAMPLQMAYMILREHAGSQWDPNVVEAVIAVYPTMLAHSPLDGVGRTADRAADDLDLDLDLTQLDDLLAAVDVEI